jgi:hypothetical protein
MWGLLHLVIRYLLCQVIVFFCSFLNLDINMSKLKNIHPLCIFLPMNGTMYQTRNLKVKIYQQIRLQSHLQQVPPLYHSQNKCFHKSIIGGNCDDCMEDEVPIDCYDTRHFGCTNPRDFNSYNGVSSYFVMSNSDDVNSYTALVYSLP